MKKIYFSVLVLIFPFTLVGQTEESALFPKSSWKVIKIKMNPEAEDFSGMDSVKKLALEAMVEQKLTSENLGFELSFINDTILLIKIPKENKVGRLRILEKKDSRILVFPQSEKNAKAFWINFMYDAKNREGIFYFGTKLIYKTVRIN